MEKKVNTAISSLLKSIFEEYSAALVSKLNLDEDKVNEVWNELYSDVPIQKQNNNNKNLKKQNNNKNNNKNIKKQSNNKNNNKNIKKQGNNNDENKKCPYIFTKGNRNGEACGANIRNGGTYCSRHKKFEGQVIKDRKQFVPETIKECKKIVLRKHRKIGQYWHSDSKMIFKSKEEKVVIGKIDKDGSTVNDLNEEDIEECKKWSFKFEEKKKED